MSNKTAEKLLDARELEAPLPLEYAIKILSSLEDGEYLKMIHRMKPCKLDAILDANGFGIHILKTAATTIFTPQKNRITRQSS